MQIPPPSSDSAQLGWGPGHSQQFAEVSGVMGVPQERTRTSMLLLGLNVQGAARKSQPSG